MAVVSGKALCSSFIDSTYVPWIILILSSRMYGANGSSMWSIELCLLTHMCEKNMHVRCMEHVESDAHRDLFITLWGSLTKKCINCMKQLPFPVFSPAYTINHDIVSIRVHFIMRDQITHFPHVHGSPELVWREIDYSPLSESYNKSTPFTIMKFSVNSGETLFFKILVILQKLYVCLPDFAFAPIYVIKFWPWRPPGLRSAQVHDGLYRSCHCHLTIYSKACEEEHMDTAMVLIILKAEALCYRESGRLY